MDLPSPQHLLGISIREYDKIPSTEQILIRSEAKLRKNRSNIWRENLSYFYQKVDVLQKLDFLYRETEYANGKCPLTGVIPQPVLQLTKLTQQCGYNIQLI